VIRAWSRAFLSQWHGKMLLMSIAPFLLALGVWAVAVFLSAAADRHCACSLNITASATAAAG
jgi:hypothetical protein